MRMFCKINLKKPLKKRVICLKVHVITLWMQIHKVSKDFHYLTESQRED